VRLPGAPCYAPVDLPMKAPFPQCLALLLATGCLDAWTVGGPWACGNGTCPAGYACDDGVCCKPGGTPVCPTLPAPNGMCPDGSPARLYFEDKDLDGDGNPRVASVRCAAGLRGAFTTLGTDCDDTDPAIRLGGAELCNGRDDNCDGQPDEGLSPQRDFFLDSDGDGFGQDGARVTACASPPGFVQVGGDCAPFDAAKYPGAPERCNGLDDDCDGVADQAEATLADVGPGFPCTTAQLGACRDGQFSCLPEPGGGVLRTCTALLSPSRERCDNADNDCDGLTDEAPDCGGPASFFGAADVTVLAQKVANASTLLQQCQRSSANPAEAATPDGRWSGTTAGYHLWSIAPADGGSWDLSNPNATLRLAFTASATGASATRGAWGDPTLSAGMQDAINPVVYLCGDSSNELMRYRLAAPSDGFKLNETRFNQALQLKAVGTSWLIGQGSGFDTSRVRRLEVLLVSTAASFTVTFSPDAGFSR
jgi:hypothetical protein